MNPAPTLLRENAGLAFLGEAAWPPSVVAERQAGKLAAAANACGRPNSDVLRRRIALVSGQPVESWQIDFPDHFTAQEAALYEQPFAQLQRKAPKDSWRNPHANPDLRRALARISRTLAGSRRCRRARLAVDRGRPAPGRQPHHRGPR